MNTFRVKSISKCKFEEKEEMFASNIKSAKPNIFMRTVKVLRQNKATSFCPPSAVHVFWSCLFRVLYLIKFINNDRCRYSLGINNFYAYFILIYLNWKNYFHLWLICGKFFIDDCRKFSMY